MINLSRRHIIAASVIGAALPRSAFAAAPGAKAPVAKKARVVDDFYGTAVPDDYRWMENPEDPDWLPFLRGQSGHARATLDAIPGRAALARRISELSGDTVVTRSVKPAGDLLFFEQRPSGANNFKLFVRDNANTRLLIDPTAMKMNGAHVSLDWWEPSFDGTHIVYGLSAAGSEASTLHIMKVADGVLLPERITDTDFGVTGWMPDGSGFFYIGFTGKRGTPEFYVDSETRFHRLGSDPKTDVIVLKRGRHETIRQEKLQIGAIWTAEGSDVAIVGIGDIRPEKAIWTVRLSELISGRPSFKPVAAFEDLVVGVALQQDELYLLSNRDRPRGRVVVTSAATPSLSTAREVLPQGAMVLEDIYPARDGVYVKKMDGGVQRLARLSAGKATEVALPFEGAIGGVFTSTARDGAYLLLTGWLSPSGIWQVSPGGTVADTGITPRSAIDVSNYQARRGFAAAKDGTRIPYTMVSRKGVPKNGRNPVLASAYGAYQLSSTPSFRPSLLPFLDAGGEFVNVNVRGGGEFGREWHLAGKKATKPNTWRDLIAVCESLIAEKITSPAHLAIQGTSAGGIAVGRAMTERPDLFAAVISDVGWSNPIRYTAEQNIADIDEWGPITDEKSFKIMYDMDSYQAVKDGVRYPALMGVTGATDPRVAPWHVAKLAARVQAATASKNPVLLRVDFAAGHGIGSTRTQRDELAADIYSFVFWQTGMKNWAPV